jgi:hypothetical protein
MDNDALNGPASPAEMGPLITSLRDLHEPAPISWWPLAPAWWVLALVGLLFTAWWLWRRYQQRAALRLGAQIANADYRSWQTHQNDTQYLSDVNTTLRRIALTVKPRHEVAKLTGSRWVAMLNAMSSHQLADQSAHALSELAYQPAAQASVERLHADILKWINQLKGFESGKNSNA